MGARLWGNRLVLAPAERGAAACAKQAVVPHSPGARAGQALRAVAGGSTPVTSDNLNPGCPRRPSRPSHWQVHLRHHDVSRHCKTNRPIDPVEPKPAKLVIELLRLNWSNQLEISKRAGPIRRGACGPGRRGSLTGAGRRRIAARALPGQRARPDSGEVAAAAGSAQTADAFA